MLKFYLAARAPPPKYNILLNFKQLHLSMEDADAVVRDLLDQDSPSGEDCDVTPVSRDDLKNRPRKRPRELLHTFTQVAESEHCR